MSARSDRSRGRHALATPTTSSPSAQACLVLALGLVSCGGSGDEPQRPLAETTAVVAELRERFGGGDSGPPPVLDAVAHDDTAPARPALVRLPTSAVGAFEIEDVRSTCRVAVLLAETRRAAAGTVEGLTVFEHASARAAAWVLRPSRVGIEDAVLVERGPAAVRYALELGGAIAGLRLVGGSLELLDAGGAPCLRVAPPRVIAAGGASHPAALSVEGCAFDRDPAPPWGRPVTAAGAASCTLRVAWSEPDVGWPALVDPAWSTTGTMNFERREHIQALLANGRVLAAGGEGAGTPSDSAEIYDSATGTWALTSSMVDAHVQGAAATLDTGRVIVLGGFPAATLKSELFDPAAGTWTAGPPLATSRARVPAVKLATGKVLVAGGPPGNIASAELYDPAPSPGFPNGKWGPAGSMTNPRQHCTATLLANGDVIVVGGIQDDAALSVTASAERYSAGTWSVLPSLQNARYGHGATRLADGRVLVTGGVGPVQTNLKTAEIFDPASSTWSSAPDMTSARYGHAAALLPSGRALVAAGAKLGLGDQTSSEAFDPATSTWLPAGSLTQGRTWLRPTVLATGQVVIAGGWVGSSTLKSVEIFTELAAGQACAAAGQCASGHCIDGVCCDSDCTGVCRACTAAKKGAGTDGVCGPIAAGSDPDDECKDDGGAVCDDDGFCDGALACEKYPVSMGCTPSPCAANADCTSGHCVEGICCDTGCTGTCVACTAAAKQSGPDGTCGPAKAGTDPHQTCTDDGSPSCEQDGLCDGAGACEKYPVSAGCTPEPCSSGADCTTGHCVDGVCCDTACGGPCSACTAAKKGSGQDGVCGPVAADTDPDSDCSPDPGFPGSCLADGACDGAGQCRPFAKLGVSCGLTSCQGNTVSGFICNGGGECIQSSASCDPYLCEGSACTSTCADINDCVASAYCTTTMACADKLSTSSPCSTGVECETGFCVDGFCCNSDCSGQCQACDVVPNVGSCSTVTGAPHGAKTACAGEGACAGTCNGIAPAACSYPGSTTSCDQTCADGAATTSVCDGDGTCTSGQPTPCSPYVCAGSTCGTGCDADADCDTGYGCTDGKCVPKAVATCDGDHTLTLPNGQTSDCTPFRCAGTACKDTCTTVDDCVAPNVCDASGRCVGRAASPADDGGCGCRVGGGANDARGWLLGAQLAALSLLLARRRSARRRDPARRAPPAR